MMAIVQRLSQLEDSLQRCAEHWDALTDNDYMSVVKSWETTFRSAVEQRHRRLSGHRAQDAFANRLPADVYLLSGIRIFEIANLGGKGAPAYRVE